MMVELSMQYCRKKIGFIWDIWNVSTAFNYWVWAQSRRSKSWIRLDTFSKSPFKVSTILHTHLTNIYCRSVPLSVNIFLDFWTSLNPSKRTVVVIYSDLMKSTGFKTVHSSYWEKYYPVYFVNLLGYYFS